MVFPHGFPEDWTLYRRYLLEFGRDHLAVAPNPRGVRPSDRPEEVEAYAMPRLLGDLHALLDHFGREGCILVANDWGAYLAWVFASAYPRRVERLVIMNGPHPAVLLREHRTSPAQIAASQYERPAERHRGIRDLRHQAIYAARRRSRPRRSGRPSITRPVLPSPDFCFFLGKEISVARAYGSSAPAHKARDRIQPGCDRQLHPHAVQPLQPRQRAGPDRRPGARPGARSWRRSRT